jgi:hypothetical protein
MKRLILRRESKREDEYPFLRFKRPNEKISRIDRYSIMMYWDDYDIDGNPAQMNELLFYPSKFGIEEIEEYQNNGHKGRGIDKLVHQLKQLIQYGNCWWGINVEEELTPNNWLLREPKVSSFQNDNYKPPKETITINNDKPKRLKLR